MSNDDAPTAHHVPVLSRESVELLAPERGGWFVDATLGLGGHAEALLEANEAVHVLGIDRDPDALALARDRLARFGDRFRALEDNFERLPECLERAGLEKVAGILADLGVSSLQLDRASRGFSFRRNGPLDMRMSPTDSLTAAQVVNEYAEDSLRRILWEYGEERQARRIASALVERRAERPFETTGELRDAVARAVGPGRPGSRARKIDPATRTFQALRIEVNRELAGLRTFLDKSLAMLETEGRLVVISYHSLEDRLVKTFFRKTARGEVDPITGRSRSETQLIEILTRKPIRPTEAEVAHNPRSRSARLRAARRL